MPSALSLVKRFFPNVIDLRDAKKNMYITVTKKDCAAARRKQHSDCAMAVAAKRAMNLDGVVMAINVAYLVKNNRAFRLMVPESVQREIISFDRGGGFTPGEYRLSRPTKTKRLEYASGGNAPHKNTAKYREPKHQTTGIRTVLAA